MGQSVRKEAGFRRRSSRRVLLTVGITIFIAVDIMLVALALGWGQAEPVTSAPNPPAQSDATAHEDRSPVETPTPSLEAHASQSAPRLLSVVSDNVAWRSEGGPCDERGSLELTLDGGQTWNATYPPEDQWGRPLWLSGADYTAVQSVIASGPDCDLEGLRTFDSGASWDPEEQVVTDSVLVDPNDPAVVIWGSEDIAGPCETMSNVAVTGGVATAVCVDGSLWSITYGGNDWSGHGVQGAVALDASDGRWVAAVESAECEGLRILEFAEASTENLACAPTEADGAVALGLSGSTLWLWAGEQVFVSVDGGRTLD